MYLSCPDFHCSALAMHTQLPVVLGVLPTWDAIGKTRQTALPPARFCHPKWPRRLRMRVKWACLHNLYTNFSDFLFAHNVIMNSTKVQNPRQNSYAGTGCRHYTMHCLTFEQQVPRNAHTVYTLYTLIYTAHARTSASLPSRASPVSRLFHTGCTSSWPLRQHSTPFA